MPWVEVFRDEKIVSDGTLRNLISVLPHAVAETLDIPNNPKGRLTFRDIEIKTFNFNKFDVHSKPLAIIIHSEVFVVRRKNIKKRCELIRDRIKGYAGGAPGFIWVPAYKDSFVEF